jgi:hypothetical protein
MKQIVGAIRRSQRINLEVLKKGGRVVGCSQTTLMSAATPVTKTNGALLRWLRSDKEMQDRNKGKKKAPKRIRRDRAISVSVEGRIK